MTDQGIDAAGKVALVGLLGEHAQAFIRSAETAICTYFALREAKRQRLDNPAINSPEAAEKSCIDIADTARALWEQLSALDVMHWSLIRQQAFVREPGSSLADAGDVYVIEALQDLSLAASDVASQIRLDMKAGRSPDPGGVVFIGYIAERWQGPGKVSAARKSMFYRAVRIVCERSRLPLSDPTRWIRNYLDLRNS